MDLSHKWNCSLRRSTPVLDIATVIWNSLDSKYSNYKMKIPFFHSVKPILFDLSEQFVLVQIAEVHSNSQNLLSRMRKNRYVTCMKLLGMINKTRQRTHIHLYLHPKCIKPESEVTWKAKLIIHYDFLALKRHLKRWSSSTIVFTLLKRSQVNETKLFLYS